jgi:formylglycine-generating enzyme required for sulfatase activity
MNALGYKDLGPNAFPTVNSGSVKQDRSVALTVNGTLNASEFRGVFSGTVTGTLFTGTLVGGGSGWTASAENATLMGYYKSSPSSTAVPAAILVSFNGSLQSSAFIPPIAGSLRVSGGSYMMGDTLGDVRRDEVPVHHVRLDSFTISRAEVSKEDWDSVRDQANLLNKGYQISPGAISVPPGAMLAGGTVTLAGGIVVNSSATVYVKSTASLVAGMLLSGSGIVTGAKIESILSGKSFLMSSVAFGSFNNTVIQAISNLAGGTATLAGGTVANSSAAVYVKSTASLVPGMLLSGSGIVTGAKIESILSGTSLLMSSVASGSFNNTVIQAISDPKKYPVVGIAWEETLKWCNAKSEIEGLTPCYYLTDSAMNESITVVGTITAGSALVRIPITKDTDRIGVNSVVSVVSGSGSLAAQPQKAKVIRMEYERLSRTGRVTSKSNQVTGISGAEELNGMYVSGWGIGLSPTGNFLPVMITAAGSGSITLSSAVTLGTVQTMSLGSRTVTVSSIASTSTLTALEFFDRNLQPVWQRVVVLETSATVTDTKATLEFNPPARSSANVYRSGKVYNMNNAKVDWSANGYRLPTEAEWEYVAKVDLASLAFKGGTVSNGTLGYKTMASAAQPSAFTAAQSGAVYSPLWLGAGPLYNGTLSSSVVAENTISGGTISGGTMFLTQAPPYRRFPVASSVESSVLSSLGSYLHKDLANYQPNTPSIPAGTRLGGSFPNIGSKVWDLTPFFPMINPSTRKRQFHPVWGGYSAPTSDLPIETNGTQGMAGNVWEWCWDYYGAYRPEPVTNPRGPGTGSRRVIRGGGAKYDAAYCRATDRGLGGPIFSSSCFEIGFRWVRK